MQEPHAHTLERSGIVKQHWQLGKRLSKVNNLCSTRTHTSEGSALSYSQALEKRVKTIGLSREMESHPLEEM